MPEEIPVAPLDTNGEAPARREGSLPRQLVCWLWCLFAAQLIGMSFHHSIMMMVEGRPTYGFSSFGSYSDGHRDSVFGTRYQYKFKGEGVTIEFTWFLNLLLAGFLLRSAWLLSRHRLRWPAVYAAGCFVLAFVPFLLGAYLINIKSYTVGMAYLGVGIFFLWLPAILLIVGSKNYHFIDETVEAKPVVLTSQLRLAGTLWVVYGLLAIVIALTMLFSWVSFGQWRGRNTFLLDATAVTHLWLPLSSITFGAADMTNRAWSYAGGFLQPQFLMLVWGGYWLYRGLMLLLNRQMPGPTWRRNMLILSMLVLVVGFLGYFLSKIFYTLMPNMLFPGGILLLLSLVLAGNAHAAESDDVADDYELHLL